MDRAQFCSECGAKLHNKPSNKVIIDKDECFKCGFPNHSYPVIVSGCIVEYENQILLCKRKFNPRAGLWALPAGFVEEGETTEQAAIRETQEECNCSITKLSLYTVVNCPCSNIVVFLYRSKLSSDVFYAGRECLDVTLFNRRSIPWEQLDYLVTKNILEKYFKDKNNHKFLFRILDAED